MKSPNRGKIIEEAIQRIEAFQRNKLTPIITALNHVSDETIQKKKEIYIKHLNELIVNVAVTKKDESYYQRIIEILESQEKLTRSQKNEAVRIMNLAINRLSHFTNRLKSK